MTKRKYFSLVVILFLLVVFLIGKADAMNADLPLLGKVIFVDPGHGGRDPGTMYQDIYEKDINLDISFALQEELMKKGAIVYMTREKDEDLSSEWDAKKKRSDLYRRIKMFKEKKSDIYLSIHINWYKEQKWYGAEVLYNEINPKNKILAELIMNEFTNQLKSTRHITTTDLYMYENTTVPGVLIECGYLSNPNERKLLQTKEYQTKLAKAITNGVLNYFNQASQ